MFGRKDNSAEILAELREIRLAIQRMPSQQPVISHQLDYLLRAYLSDWERKHSLELINAIAPLITPEKQSLLS